MTRSSLDLPRVLGALGVLWALSVAALVVAGIPIVAPWGFLVWIVVLVLPFAYCLTLLLGQLEAAPERLPALLLSALGLVALWLLPPPTRMGALLPPILFLCVVLRRAARPPRTSSRLSSAVVATMVVGFLVVWNLNFLFASAVAHLHDESVRHVDLAVYAWLFDGDHEPLYPLIRSRVLFGLLEKAYDMLPVEVFVVPFVLCLRGHDPTKFVRRVFLCYFVGLLVFIIYPVVGPCITYRSTFDPAFFDGSRSLQLMDGMASQFRAVQQRTAGTGMAYFVALPSLHVALCVVFQHALRVSRSHFLAFLPINALLVASTLVLGYHYILDVPAGVLLALFAIVVVRDVPAVRNAALSPTLVVAADRSAARLAS